MQGSYRNRKTEFQDFSRTIPGLFSFFKDPISSQFCIKLRKKNALFSTGSEKRHNRLFFILISGDKNGELRTN